MPSYEVGVHLTYYGSIEVEADTPEEAMKHVKENFDAEYIADSTESADAEYTIEAEEGE